MLVVACVAKKLEDNIESQGKMASNGYINFDNNQISAGLSFYSPNDTLNIGFTIQQDKSDI
jgi:hypothetical protein